MEVDILAEQLNNSISTPRELRCREYAFKLKMNPWQHPTFDPNIYHLLALLTPLCRGCGGVIYFLTDDIQPVTQEIFQVYKERFKTLIASHLESFSPWTNMVQVGLKLGTHRSWAALLLKRSDVTLKYPPVETEGTGKPTAFDIDIFGHIHTIVVSDTQNQSNIAKNRPSVSSGHGTERSALPQANSQKNIPHQTEQETSSASAPSPVTVLAHSDDTEILKMDFSSCQRLDWTENTKDWQKYVTIKELKTDDIVESCPIWKPTQPMKITPDRDFLRYLFASETFMDETLSAVTTFDPGCAVVCRTWRFHIDDSVPEELPPGHICDILTVTDTGRLSFWVVINNLDKEKIHSVMEYLMTTGRMLKYQLIQKGEGDDLSNLWIDCRLLPNSTSHSTEQAVKLRLSECQEIQEHLHDMCQNGVDVSLLQRTLTKLILSKESPLKRCVGEHTSITLSAQQAEVLMHRAKVNYITGPAGSGKSYTAVSLYKMYGKERSVYICTTKEFVEYLKFNGCAGTLMCCDQDLLKEIESGTFDNKICVVIDDCHKLMCTKKSMKKLFKVLKENRDMSLFVFADNDYQSFDRRRQQSIHDCIQGLAHKVLQDTPLNFRLTDIYPNTRKIVSFMQAAIQDVYDGHQKIESVNIENGDGVECTTMSSLWENSPDNDLVVYLCSLLLSGNYSQSEVAILFESSYSPDKIRQCKDIVAANVPGVTVQNADTFPRTGVIVDTVDSFLGLDASVCVFILSNTRKTLVHPLQRIFQQKTTRCDMNMYNPRYEVFLASRATYKAVFVVPELHEDLVHQMKFDHFQVCAWEVNKSSFLLRYNS